MPQFNVTILEARITEILKSLPPDVTVVAAAKTRTPEEVLAAIRAGIKYIGYNYVQEAESMQRLIGQSVQWHMIGHLQRNKIKKSARLFDMIQTLDSIPLSEILDRECGMINKKIPVLVEVNSARENSKAGIFPEEVLNLIEKIKNFSHLHVQGLMTMGPLYEDPEKSRPYFRLTRQTFELVNKQKWPEVSMRFLSMGMSDSYKIAIEEGANMVRLGTIMFGSRRI
jgi:pyridoxal phosphate enzyme (YggS family)